MLSIENGGRVAGFDTLSEAFRSQQALSCQENASFDNLSKSNVVLIICILLEEHPVENREMSILLVESLEMPRSCM